MSNYDMAQRKALSALVAPPLTGTASALAQRAAEGSSGISCRLGDASCASAHAARVSRSALGDGAMLHRSLRHLQRDFGNHYVGQVIHRAAGEPSEGETATDAVERSIEGARGGGQGMDHGTRTRMESAFGADFSGVRIHHDSRADGLSEALSARAFTTGRDVFFRQGEYNPGTSSGRELLAHELTHVVQQNGDGVQRKMSVSQPGDPHEIEAEEMARTVMQQEHAVQRQPEAPKSDEDEEKMKVHTKADGAGLSRAEDEEKLE